MALTFSDLLTPNGTDATASSFVTASIAPTAGRLLVAIALNKSVSGTPNTPTLSGGGVATWTAGPTVVLSSRRMTALYALTGGAPTSEAVTIDLAGQSTSTCIWQVVEVTGSLLTGTNGADALVQSIYHAATSGTAIDLELATPWADAANRGVTALFSATTGTTFTMLGSGFTQLGAHGASGRAMTAFYGRDADDLTLGATASLSAGVKIGLGLEIAAASTEATPTFTAYPPIRTYGLNRRLN